MSAAPSDGTDIRSRLADLPAPQRLYPQYLATLYDLRGFLKVARSPRANLYSLAHEELSVFLALHYQAEMKIMARARAEKLQSQDALDADSDGETWLAATCRR